MYVLWWQS